MTTTDAGPFYDAARHGNLALAYCPACDRYDLPGTRVCPSCLSTSLQWRAASGKGTVYSYVVFHRALHPDFDVPYAVVVVELDEGPRLVGSVVGAPARVGLRVTATFDAAAHDVPVRFETAPETATQTEVRT